LSLTVDEDFKQIIGILDKNIRVPIFVHYVLAKTKKLTRLK